MATNKQAYEALRSERDAMRLRLAILRHGIAGVLDEWSDHDGMKEYFHEYLHYQAELKKLDDQYYADPNCPGRRRRPNKGGTPVTKKTKKETK